MPPWLEVRSLLRHVVDWSYVFPMAAFGNLIARRAAIVRFLVHRSTADPTTWDAPSEREALASYLERVARPPAATMTRALYGAFVRRELLAAIRADGGSPVPTTVVVGEHETIARPELWQQRTSQGQVHLTTIAGADHWLAEEAPQATLAAITAGLARR
jgi:pimeloyl-ACP methyl ester carboxylesterase